MAVEIPYVREFEPKYGHAETVAPGLRRVLANNPGPFTFHGTGTYIVGEGAVAVIDPGPLLDDHVAALLTALEGQTVSHILLTHTHADHSPAAAPLKAATGAPTYAFGPHGSGKWAEGVKVEEGGDMDFDPDYRLADGDLVQGGGWTMEAVHTPGHTSNHLCFSWCEAGMLFPGDHVMGWSTSIVSPPDGDMGQYIASLEKLLARDEHTYWPTHGGPITDPARHVAAFIAHRQERAAQILSCVDDGQQTLQAMVPVIYQGLDERLFPAAARSTFASIVYLVEQGQLVASEGLSMEASFSRTG